MDEQESRVDIMFHNMMGRVSEVANEDGSVVIKSATKNSFIYHDDDDTNLKASLLFNELDGKS